jgi:glucans biosynthesis protein
VISTRRDRGTEADAYRFVIDFRGRKLAAIAGDEVLRGVVSVASGEHAAQLLDQHVVKNPVNGDWRLTFQVRPKGKAPVDLRAFLEQKGEALTETWSYTLLP